MANTIEQRGFFWWFKGSRNRIRRRTPRKLLFPVYSPSQRTVRQPLQIDGTLCGNDERTDWTKPRSFPASYQLTEKGIRVALMFILFHQRICGPLANTLFHRRPTQFHTPATQLQLAYQKADASIQQIIDLLAA
jgi:hypothetical protein